MEGILPCFAGIGREIIFLQGLLSQGGGKVREREKDEAVFHPRVETSHDKVRIVKPPGVQVHDVAVAELDLVAVNDTAGNRQRLARHFIGKNIKVPEGLPEDRKMIPPKIQPLAAADRYVMDTASITDVCHYH